MPLNRPRRRLGLAAALVLVAATGAFAAAEPPADKPPGDFAAVRQACIAAARDTQQRETALAALTHQMELLDKDIAGRQRGLDESRVEQTRLLGTIEWLSRHPPGAATHIAATPIDRLRGESLIGGITPALRTQAHALSAEIVRLAALRREVEAKQRQVDAARETLASEQSHLAEVSALRLDLAHQLLPADATAASRLAKLGHDSKDIADLIKRADAASERLDRESADRRRHPRAGDPPDAVASDAADPIRPIDLHTFDPPQSRLAMPLAGRVSRRFGAADAAGNASHGESFAALPGATVVAPFDGRVVYQGQFRDLGVVLIIRHGDLYHSLLAGLAHVDTALGQWVVAGEPVGALPDAPAADRPPQREGSRQRSSEVALYFEFRRDGQPVDPQPWLAARDEGRGEQDGDQKVRE